MCSLLCGTCTYRYHYYGLGIKHTSRYYTQEYVQKQQNPGLVCMFSMCVLCIMCLFLEMCVYSLCIYVYLYPLLSLSLSLSMCVLHCMYYVFVLGNVRVFTMHNLSLCVFTMHMFISIPPPPSLSLSLSLFLSLPPPLQPSPLSSP